MKHSKHFKNEMFVRAMGSIDESLIADAQNGVGTKKLKPKRIKYFGVGAAACLLLVCTAAFVFLHGGLPGFSNGAQVARPAVVSLPDVLSYDARGIDTDIITAPIDIISDGDFTVDAEDGNIEVYSAKTNELLQEGRSCKAKGPATVKWSIENPDTGLTYEIGINGRETVLILKFETKTNNWIIESEDQK